MMSIVSFLGLFAASALISAVVTRVSIALAVRRNLLDHPNERSLHTQPVPRVGGIGIVLGFLAPFAILRHGAHWWVLPTGMAAMAGVGLLDDFLNLAASRKYLLQLAIVALLMYSGLVVRELSLPMAGAMALGWLAVPLTLVWLTGFPNFFNFMDGTNGMAGGTGAIYGAFFAAFAYVEGRPELAMAGLLMAGSSMGFLVYNFPRAKTFMGDAGSLFLGLGAAILVLPQQAKTGGPVSAGEHVLAALMLCSVFIYDCTTTILTRLARGENILAAHRSHYYQRLARAGWGHTRVAWLYFAMHCVAGVLGMIYLKGTENVRVAALAADAAMLAGLSVLVRTAENTAQNVRPFRGLQWPSFHRSRR
jgi:UDP-N-acetylmuramyl pentapeptide phosphotransferase/UDP-N-acetylglucosamine-1-phosphate transferase